MLFRFADFQLTLPIQRSILEPIQMSILEQSIHYMYLSIRNRMAQATRMSPAEFIRLSPHAMELLVF